MKYITCMKSMNLGAQTISKPPDLELKPRKERSGKKTQSKKMSCPVIINLEQNFVKHSYWFSYLSCLNQFEANGLNLTLSCSNIPIIILICVYLLNLIKPIPGGISITS